jgi:acyl-CoA synthetase (NDP forming)
MTDVAARVFGVRRVAVFGASDGSKDPWSFNARLTRAVLSSSLDDVVLISLKPGPIDGHPTVRALSDLSGKVDMAVLAVPGPSLAPAIDDCAEHDVRTCVVIAASVSEEGRAAIERARQRGVRFIGPNCVGFVDNENQVRIYAGGTLPSPLSGSARVAVITQSGGFASALIAMGEDAGLEFGHVFTTGEEIDIGMEDCLEELLAIGASKVIVLFIEKVRQPERFRRLTRTAYKAGVKVIALRVGRSAVAREVALAHTGAIIDDWDAAQSALHADGVITCDSIQQVVDTAVIAARTGRHVNAQVQVVTSSGALGALAADLAEAEGLSLVPPGQTLASLAFPGHTPEQCNPLDTSTAGGSVNTLRTLADAAGSAPAPPAPTAESAPASPVPTAESAPAPPAPGALLFCHTGATYESEVTAQLVRLKPLSRHFLLTVWPGATSATTAQLGSAGIACIPDARRALGAYRSVARWSGQVSATLDLPIDVGAPRDTSRELLGYLAGRKLLERWGAPGPAFAVIDGDRGSAELLSRLRPPLVVKVAAGANHKAAAGGVVLGIPSAADVIPVVDRLRDIHDGPFLVEEQIDSGLEILVDVRRSVFGDVLTIGWGGSAAEQIADAALTCAPFDAQMIRQTFCQTRISQCLRSVTSEPGRLADELVRFCLHLADMFRAAKELAEIEINPVILNDAGAFAADVRAIGYTAAEQRLAGSQVS